MALDLASLRGKRVVVLPDLYVDALAFLPAWPAARRKMDAVARRGGGNIPVDRVEFKLGGNAANLALALARLGVGTQLIAETDPLGHHLLQRAAVGLPLDMSRVRHGAAAATVGLECQGANVMLSHSGPVQRFGPERLERADWDLIDAADAVALVNWSQNALGTDMLESLAARLARRGKFLYFDTGDPRNRLADARRLIKRRQVWNGVGAFGMNENELRAMVPDAGRDLVAAAQDLSGRLGTRIDLHTRAWAASVTATGAVRVKAGAQPGRRVTGAGDAWNAGNLAGQMLGLSAARRLGLAHRVATAYVTGASGLPPTAAEVAR